MKTKRVKRRLFKGAIYALLVLSLLGCSPPGDGRNPFLEDIIPPIPGEPNCSDPIQPSGFHAGNGSSDRPYLICSYEQFNSIRDDMDAHYILGQDIDARPSWSEDSGACTPFDGNSVASTMACDGFWGFPGNFRGGLDGRGYALRNLYSNRSPPGSPTGIIFQNIIENSAYIRNFGIIDPRVLFGNAGGLLGRDLQGSLENSYIVTQSGVAGFSYSGTTISALFFSRVGSNGRIRNSFTDFESLGTTQIGAGLALRITAPSASVLIMINNCYTRGSISMLGGGELLGGISSSFINAISRNLYSTVLIDPIGAGSTGGLFSGIGSGADTRVEGTNYFVSDVANAQGIGMGGINTDCDMASMAICRRGAGLTATNPPVPTSDADALSQIRALSVLPADWSADDWDLRGPTQVPALKYAGGPDVCGRLCGQLIPNQRD